LGNEQFLGQIDEELGRLQTELESTKEAMVKAQAIFEDCKVKQQRLIQELKAVDMMKQNLVGLDKETDKPETEPAETTEVESEEDLQQPPENYEEKEN
jgi:hypothetical protein